MSKREKLVAPAGPGRDSVQVKAPQPFRLTQMLRHFSELSMPAGYL